MPDAPVALQHNLGLGGAAVVTLYRRADGKTNSEVPDVSKVSNSGYNPAVEARPVTKDQIKQVVSRTQTSSWLGVADRKVQAML